MKLTIGADPELFLQTISGKMISAVGLIGGTKEEPKPLDVKGCAVQEDNVSAEFNIPPAKNFNEFKKSIKYVMSYLDNRAQEMGLLLAKHVASYSFDEDQLASWQAQVFGCEPDFNAWTGKMNPKPQAKDFNLRSCGGHIHVGNTGLDPVKIIRAMDLFLGVPSIFLDKDKERRNLYGKAGAHRIKSYGPEYRTLSNFWIWQDDTIEWAWENTVKAVEFVKAGGTITNELGDNIQEAINNTNLEIASNIMVQYG